MEKKTIAALIVTGAMVLGLSACGTNGATSGNADNSQSTSTPTVTEPVDTSTQGTEQTTPDTSETTPEPTDNTPVSQTETEQETQPTAQPQEESPVPEEVGPKFTEVNETVYATTSVNVRASYSADSDKVGGLSAGASATRTGVGDNGWSRIVYGDSVAYVSSDYLTTTKPSTGSNQTSKPSTGGNASSGGNTGNSQTTTPTTPTDSGSSGGSTGGGEYSGWDSPEDKQEWIDKVNGSGDGTYYGGGGALITPGL